MCIKKKKISSEERGSFFFIFIGSKKFPWLEAKNDNNNKNMKQLTRGWRLELK